MPKRTKAIALALLLAAACGRDAGIDAYRAGRFREAQTTFGTGTAARDLYNRALAALRAGDLRDADASAQKAAAIGGPGMAARCDFLRGNAVFALCEIAERQAETPAAEPFAFDVAIAYAKKAGESWRSAAMSRADWPEARRNVERALLKLEQLRNKKKAKEDRRRSTDPKPKPRPKPKPKPEGGDGKKTEEDASQKPQLKELSPEQVLRLMEKLAEKEREKAEMRRSSRRARSGEVERDW